MKFTSTYDLIAHAIQNKMIVTATYQGHHREMCPHVLGKKNGRTQCLFYQFGGSSKSAGVITPGSPKNWRCIPIDELINVDIISGEWQTASNHSVPQTCVDEIYYEVNI